MTESLDKAHENKKKFPLTAGTAIFMSACFLLVMGLCKFSFYVLKNHRSAVSRDEFIQTYVDVQPFARKTGEKEIQQFRDSLKLQKWEAKRFSVKSLPGMMIYFDKNLHVNLETEHEGIFWMSVHSPQGSAYFSVPSSVYTGLTQLSGYKPS